MTSCVLSIEKATVALRTSSKRLCSHHGMSRRRNWNHSSPQRLLSSSSSSSVAVTENNTNLPSKMIDFSVSAKIEGEESQIAKVKLRNGETLRAESGAMLFMTHGVEMSTDLHGASSAFSRMMTGQNVFLTDFTYRGDKEGTVGLGTDFPSKILRLTLSDYPNGSLIAQRGAYLASNPSVDIQMEFTKSLSAGFFGGQGFILQKMSGQGDVLVKAGGTLVEKELAEGETIRVTSGSIVAFTTTVDYDIQMMPGIKNAMFGGEGLFVTTLKGPGKVWLQGMPPDRMIAEIARRVPSGGIGLGIPLGMGGSGESTVEEEGSDQGEDGTGDAEEMVAATDSTIEADRQATVASSGMMSEDADSPSALYGDAAPTDEDNLSSTTSDQDHLFNETTFKDDESSFGEESVFSNDTSSSTSFSSSDDFDQQTQEDFFGEGDQSTTEFFEAESTATEEAGNSIGDVLGSLWDFFTGDD